MSGKDKTQPALIPEWYTQGGVGYGDKVKTGLAEKITIGIGSLVAKYLRTSA